jgi:hypothetical protein
MTAIHIILSVLGVLGLLAMLVDDPEPVDGRVLPGISDDPDPTSSPRR